MKPLEMLNQVKELLGVETESSIEDIKLAQMKLENGTVLEAESFESDQAVFIVTEDERVALPLGEYELEDGKILVIEEEGIIKEIIDSKPEQEEVEEEIEASEEISEELEEEKEEEIEAKYVTKEELTSVVDEIKAMIEDLKGPHKEEEEMSEQVGLAVTEMLSKEEPVELAEETKKVNHSPEGKEKNKINLYSKNRAQTIKDRVLNRILN
jgi:hypothetical protein